MIKLFSNASNKVCGKKRSVKNDVTVAMACVTWRALSGFGARARERICLCSVLSCIFCSFFVLFLFLQEGQLNIILSLFMRSLGDAVD